MLADMLTREQLGRRVVGQSEEDGRNVFRPI